MQPTPTPEPRPAADGGPGPAAAVLTRQGHNGHRPDMGWPTMTRVNGTHPTTPTATTETPTGRWAKIGDTVRLVAPLLLVNALAVYGQVAYAYDHIALSGWPTFYRVLLAVGFAAAIEAVALYVGWQAHASLLVKAYAAARWRRVASYLLAAVVGGINYAHWANGWTPTEAAIAFGLLSLLSPWLWGMHSRRVQHIQLVKEALIDEAGAQFSTKRWRRFPVRTYRAVSWSIEHNVRDPQQAWNGYREEWLAQRRKRATVEALPVPTAADREASTPAPADRRPVAAKTSTARRSTTPTAKLKKAAPTPPVDGRKWPPVAIRDAASLRAKFGTTDDPPGRNEIGRQMEWNTQKASDARAAYLAGADLAGVTS